MTTLVLSGWAQPANALAHLVEGDDVHFFDWSHYPNPRAAIAALRDYARGTEIENIVAWSMGGQLAMRAITAGALKPKHLTLIAAPFKFVCKNFGMHPIDYGAFRNCYARDPVQSKHRFHTLLAKGDSKMRELMNILVHHPKVEELCRWLPWLDELGRFSMDTSKLASLPPTLIVHGTHDAVVPLVQSKVYIRHMKQAKLSIWDEVGHVPHLHDPERLKAEIAAHRAEVEGTLNANSAYALAA
jgi:pimeloyl-ACP methyl ester carboxylesterase